MRIKPDWLACLHTARSREIEVVFRHVPSKAFDSMLELGAGDGFQSRLLSRYTRSLIATDLNPNLLPDQDVAGIHYRICDAEEAGEMFEEEQFDVIFSSNLLEHLPDVGQALRGMHRIMKQGGVAVHIMPSPLWKLSHLVGFPFDFVARNLDALVDPDRRRQRMRRISEVLSRKSAIGREISLGDLGNNIKVQRGARSGIRRLLVPEPHGVSSTNFAEFRAFSAERWVREFQAAGFEVVSVLNGPVTSGYGFGLDRLRKLVERSGLTTEHVYVAVKAGSSSPALPWFDSGQRKNSDADPIIAGTASVA